ncbi:MAG: radical SAM protein [Candidatus Bathyarchaeota archaeon]|nr:radical SAM protein [Candidatus Bathyarchaeota archaeon]
MIANFAVTYRCNSRCSTCGIWAMEDRSRDELTLEEIEGFFEGEKELLSGVKTIQLTGGEPYLRDDIVGVAEAVWRGIPGAFVWIATNGLLPETIADRTADILSTPNRGGVGVTVSLDGVGQTHDDQRGVKDAYHRTFETLCRLSRLRETHPDMRLSMGMTITPQNQHQIKQAMKVAEYHDADLTVRPANVSEAYYRNRGVEGEWDHRALRVGLRMVTEHHIRRRGFIRAAPVISYLRRIPGYVSNGNRHLPCSAGSSSLFIDPYGAVYPCLFVNEKIGDIREKPLNETWRSSGAEEMRRRIAAGRCPGCLVECEAMRDIRRDRLGLASAALTGIAYECGRLLGVNPSS